MSSFEIVTVLAFLLPGFLAAEVIRGLVQQSRISEFERVVQALILTIVVRAILILLGHWRSTEWIYRNKGLEDQLVASVVVSLVVGIVLAAFWNHDGIRIFRYLRITRQTSYPSEWYAAFHKSKHYVILHLDGERRLYGFPDEWPNASSEGHFCMTDVEWLVKDGRTPLNETEKMLVPVSEVSMVEFLKNNK